MTCVHDGDYDGEVADDVQGQNRDFNLWQHSAGDSIDEHSKENECPEE